MSDNRIMARALRGPVTLIVCGLAALLAPRHARAGEIDSPGPEVTAKRFYRTYLRLKVIGLPTESQMRALAPMLCPPLRSAFAAARRVEERAIKAHPDEKPPFAEGDLFSSLFEGAQSYRLGHVRLHNSLADIPVHLEHRERGSVTRWTDTLVLKQAGGKWRAWDIRFGGKWQFKSGKSLRDNLKVK